MISQHIPCAPPNNLPIVFSRAPHAAFACHRMEHPARGVMDEFADITLEKGAWHISLARQAHRSH